MLVKDLAIDGKGLFHYMNELETLPFTLLFDVDELDILFTAMHGNKALSPTVDSIMANGGVTEDNLKKVASMLLTMYGMAWSRLFELYTMEIPLETYSMITTETITDSETTSHDGTNTSLRTDSDKVSGYNESTMVEDTEKVVDSEDISTSGGSREADRQVTREVRGLQGSVALEVQRIIRLMERNLIQDVVFPNVATFVGKLIY